ncbi:MAG TPA: Mur ligase family protein [Balneolaceae bacterium]|nr:Mur ligase family protein [Balneolaceae bacterium]
MIENIEDVHNYLDEIPSFRNDGQPAADFQLERFAEFCAEIDNPQRQFASIHVAGSNGKGSTCQLLASIYEQAGYDTGLYISPHLISYDERFTINGRRIDDGAMIDFFQSFEGLINRYKITYFEVSTALAFWWFARQNVDIAMIETGLGGRLDATNIISPLATLITTVTLDHTDILGETISEIAAEKAGIIKPGVPVILGNVPHEAKQVIESKADAQDAPIFDSTAYLPAWNRGRYQLTIEGKERTFNSTLRTPVQAYNIAAAWQLTEVIQQDFPTTRAQRKAGIEKVGETFPNPGRFEQLHNTLNWYFDGGHNVQSVQAMKNMVKTIKPVNDSILVLALMNDKINKKMMSEFLEFKKIIYYTLPIGRAATIHDIQPWLPNVQSFPVDEESQNKLLNEFESELVIFAGSFYFYATVRDWLARYVIDC